MKLASRAHTVGNKVFWTVDYDNWLEDGVTISSAVVTVTDASVTVGTPVIEDGHKVRFYVFGGTLNQSFTVSVSIVDTKTQTKNDTIDFTVVAP